MKLKIEIAFKDKFTGEKYEKDSIVEFEDSRAEELLADKRNLVTKVKETAPKSKKVAKKK